MATPLQTLWDKSLDSMRHAGDLSSLGYDAFLRQLEPRLLKDGVLYLFIGSDYHRSVVMENYFPILLREVRNVDNSIKMVRILAEDDPVDSEFLTTHPPDVSANFQRAAAEYSFENFVVGPSNKFAHAASQAVAGKPAGLYNPLFIYGGSGLGKTHLLSAICREIAETHPKLNLLYVKTEAMVNELVEAIRTGSTLAFRQKYRFNDVLLVDDIQFLAGKESTQTEFFHTFDELHQAGKQIVLTSDRPPREIASLEERLRNRFEMGLLADIQPPDVETRVAIVRRKAFLLGMDLPENVSLYVAEQLKDNIRQLEGVVRRLFAHQLLAGEEPTIMIAQAAIRDLRSTTQSTPVTPERILKEVARVTGISSDDIVGPRSLATVSRARQVAMYITREVLHMSLKDIGASFGDRDHSTVVYALRTVEERMKKDYSFKNMIQDLVKNIQSLAE